MFPVRVSPTSFPAGPMTSDRCLSACEPCVSLCGTWRSGLLLCSLQRRPSCFSAEPWHLLGENGI